MEEKKYVHRLPPCPDYDIPGVESWLTDIAMEGLLLEKDTPFCGFYAFSKAPPQSVRYRMEPAIKQQGFWDANPGTPKEEAQSLYQEMGWEYVTRYGNFHIYRCFDPHAPELHTDEDIQAEALNALKKRHRSDIFWLILCILFYLIFGVLRYPAGCIIAMGLFRTVCLYLFFFLTLVRPIASMLRLNKLRRQLLSGESIHKPTDWKSKALRYRILLHVPNKIFLLIMLSVFVTRLSVDAQEIKLADFSGDPPFVTIADLNPQGAYQTKGLDYAHRVRSWKYWPFVENWDWYEFASVELENGETLSGPLDVKYHRATSPLLADQLAKELIAYADTGKYFTEAVPFDTGYGTVRGLRYQGKYGLDTVMLICDNVVVEAQILVDNAEGVSANPLWIDLMCRRLISQ